MNYTECFNRSRAGGLQIVCSPFLPLCCLAASGDVQVACVGLWLLVAVWLHPEACKWLVSDCGCLWLPGCIRRRASGLCRIVVACGCLAASGGVQVACVGLSWLVAVWLHPEACKWLVSDCRGLYVIQRMKYHSIPTPSSSPAIV